MLKHTICGQLFPEPECDPVSFPLFPSIFVRRYLHPMEIVLEIEKLRHLAFPMDSVVDDVSLYASVHSISQGSLMAIPQENSTDKVFWCPFAAPRNMTHEPVCALQRYNIKIRKGVRKTMSLQIPTPAAMVRFGTLAHNPGFPEMHQHQFSLNAPQFGGMLLSDHPQPGAPGGICHANSLNQVHSL